MVIKLQCYDAEQLWTPYIINIILRLCKLYEFKIMLWGHVKMADIEGLYENLEIIRQNQWHKGI